MALSIIEEIQIINGSYGPKAATLPEIVEQAVTGEIDDFYSTVKQIDESYYPLGATYKTRMLGFIGGVVSNTNQYTIKLIRLIVSNLAQSTATIAQVNDATDAQWVGFVESEMLHSLEILAGVLPEEKAEYEASVYPAPTTTTSTTTEAPTTTTTTTTEVPTTTTTTTV